MFRFLARRVPVVYKGKPLMPMRWGRANEKVKLGKARFRLHRKLGIKYLELLEMPSGFDVQKIVLGIDPGSHFDGFSIVSEQQHHENFELIHNKNIKKRMDKRRKFRKTRRSNLRNRPARFDSRTKKQIVPTIRSMYDFRTNTIDKFCQLYPISTCVIEDVRYNHFRNHLGKGYNFSQAERGKSVLYKYLKLRFDLLIVRGYNTSKKRTDIFGSESKNSNKASKTFNAHCIDSFVLSTMSLLNIPSINKKLRLIAKIWFNKRELYQEKKLYSTKTNPNQSFYKVYRKNGIVEYLNPYYGKKSFSRIQKYKNSFRETIKINNERELKYHKFRNQYGGTVYNNISKYSIFKDLTTNKLLATISAELCKLVHSNKQKYIFIGYKRQNIEVIK